MWPFVFGFFDLSHLQGSSMLYCVSVLHSFLQLNNIPLHRQTTICLSIHQLIWIVSFFWLRCVTCRILVPPTGIEHVAPALGAQSLNHWTTREVPALKFWYRCMFSSLLGVYLGIAGLYGNSVFNFLWNCQTVFQSGCTILHLYQQKYEGSSFPKSSPHQFSSDSLILAILVGVQWCLIMVSICISLRANDVHHIFTAYWPLIYLIGEMFLLILCSF